MNKRKTFFLDTNVFLQCRDLKELPWQDVAEGQDLLLLIPRPVQEEIDKLKSDGSTRRGKRARKVSSFFRDIILSDSTSLVIQQSNPHIEVSFPDTTVTNTPIMESLDLSRADDKIINEISNFISCHPDLHVSLLTHDTNPMLTCKKIGIPFSVVPDNWLLPPEPDSRDKKINELEQKLKKMEHNHPQIEVVTLDEGNSVVASAYINITRYTDLSENEISELVTEASNRCPMKTNFDEQNEPKPPHSHSSSSLANHLLGFEWKFEKISEKEIEKYRNEDYPKWLSDYESFFKRLSFTTEFPLRHYPIEFQLSNKGMLPAENLIIEFTAIGGLLLVSPEAKQKLYGNLKLEPPVPPKAPEGHWVKQKRGYGLFDHLNPLSSASRIESIIKPSIDLAKLKRDRNAFYWKSGEAKHYSEHWIFECDEFRHQVTPESFKIVVFVPPKITLVKGGISCLITAKNLPTPVKIFFPINITYTQADTLEIAQNLLPPIP